MAASYNRVILVGNVTRDIQLKYLASGSAVCDIGLAVNRTWFDKATNSKKEAVDFIDVTFFGRLAEVLGEYASKGRPLLIEGRLQFEQWEDKDTKKKMSKLKVIGETMQLLGGGNSSNERPAAPKQADAPSSFDDASQGDDSSSVPF